MKRMIKKFINGLDMIGHKNVVLYIMLYLLCAGNLLFMHYTIAGATKTEDNLYCYDYVDNIAGVVFDVTVLLIIFLLITCRRLKCSLLMTFLVSLSWSFSNVLYSRFFGQYISWSAFMQTSNLANDFILSCLGDGMAYSDLLFVLWGAFFAYLYRLAQPVRLGASSLLKFLLLPLGTLCCNVLTVLIIAPQNYSNDSFWWNMDRRFYSSLQSTLSPQLTNFVSGSLRVLAISAWSDITVSRNLSAEERAQVHQEARNHDLRKTSGHQRADVDNVIFIIVESYLSFTSDMKVEGVEVTPCLNALKRDSNVYYNGRMRSNISIGESSDGQFIYMTGLLPLQGSITVNKAKNIKLPGLATRLKKQFGGMKARMIIPTLPSFWSQADMCRQYGFDDLFSETDYSPEACSCLNDEQIFDLAMKEDSLHTGSFFSTILTMSMHSPYSYPIESADTLLRDKSLPEKLCNYLTAAHYTDKQIGRYLQWLKNKGLYEKSLIVITADHHAHARMLDMKGKLSEDIPLYIINGKINPDTAFYGPCNQLDVYTTILDVLAIDDDWLGLGHTLLGKDYTPSVNDRISKLSEAIICGGYFN